MKNFHAYALIPGGLFFLERCSQRVWISLSFEFSWEQKAREVSSVWRRDALASDFFFSQEMTLKFKGYQGNPVCENSSIDTWLSFAWVNVNIPKTFFRFNKRENISPLRCSLLARITFFR